MAETKSKSEARYCKTPEFRASFPHVFKPFRNAEKPDEDPKFMISMLFDKRTDLKPLKIAAMNAAVEKWGSDKVKWPKKLRWPFRDGAEKADKDGYEGTIFTTATSKTRPTVIDQRKQVMTEEDGGFYAGCYARASLTAFAYDVKGNVGVSFALGNIQKVRDGQPFSGRRKAEDEFDEVEDNSENESSYSEENDQFGMGV